MLDWLGRVIAKAAKVQLHASREISHVSRHHGCKALFLSRQLSLVQRRSSGGCSSWIENREVFKALIEHVLLFALLILSLVSLDLLIQESTLAPERKELLDRIDFYLIILALVIFGISFIIKLLALSFRRNKL